MSEFTLVDLNSQYNEVIEWIKDKNETEILEWLRQYGNVSKLENPYDDSLYVFHSSTGILTNFRFDEAGHLIIFHRR